MTESPPPPPGGTLLRAARDWFLAIAVAAVVFIVVGVVQRAFDAGGGSLEGPAPPFTLDTLDDGDLSLASLHGRPVVLNFWASWCGPCRAEMPDLIRFSADYPQVQMLGVAVDSGSPADIARAAQRFGITWPVAPASRQLKRDYGVNVLPTTVVIDATGQLHHRHAGQLDYSDLVAALP